MNQNFIGYFRDKFENWKYVYNKYGNLPISDFPDNPQIVIIYTSTISIAEAIHKELLLDTLPFNILFLVEELINETLESTYYQPLKHQKLQRINVHLQGNLLIKFPCNCISLFKCWKYHKRTNYLKIEPVIAKEDVQTGKLEITDKIESEAIEEDMDSNFDF